MLLEEIAAALGLAGGRCRLEVNFTDGRLRDVVMQTRLGAGELGEQLGDRQFEMLVERLVRAGS